MPCIYISSSVTLQSNADLRLLNGPRPNFRFPNGQLFTVTGCQPVAQPPNLEGQSTEFITPGAGWPSYTPRHWVPILVAFYDLYGLMGCSGNILFSGHHTGKLLLLVWYLPFDLSGLGGPTSSYATAGIALWPHHHDQVEAPSVGIYIQVIHKRMVRF
jgi:hypothetical protein